MVDVDGRASVAWKTKVTTDLFKHVSADVSNRFLKKKKKNLTKYLTALNILDLWICSAQELSSAHTPEKLQM